MIVPHTALLAWTAVVAIPALGWLVWSPSPWPALLCLLWAGGAGWDAWSSRRALGALRVGAPGTVRLARLREDAFTIGIQDEPERSYPLRLGLVIPSVLEPREEIQTLRRRDAGAEARAEWTLCPRERGRYLIGPLHAETRSRWGLWAVRRTLDVRIEVLVYPGLLAERRHLPALFLRKGFVGLQHQRRFGKGREFEQLRDYQPGDSQEDIHWKASAKRRRLITKIFQVERTQEVYVAIDASRLSGRRVARHDAEDGEPADDALIERYVNAALLLGRAAEMQGDLFGLLTFSDRLQSFVRARRGQGHYRACLDAVCRLRTRPVSPDFGEACSFIRHRLRRRALIVLLTQLDDPVIAENLLRDIELIRRQHLVLVCMPTPPVVRPLFTDTDAVRSTEDVYAALAGHLRWRKLREVSDALHKKGVGLLLTPDDAMLARLVTHYLNIKQRQML